MFFSLFIILLLLCVTFAREDYFIRTFRPYFQTKGTVAWDSVVPIDIKVQFAGTQPASPRKLFLWYRPDANQRWLRVTGLLLFSDHFVFFFIEPCETKCRRAQSHSHCQ